MKTSLGATVVVALVVGVFGVGCGGGDDSGGEPAQTTTQQAPADTGGGGGAAQVSAVKMSEYSFAPSDVNVKAGDSLTVDNAGALKHDLKLREDGNEIGGTPLVDAGGSTKLKADFPAGRYEMFCSVPGHEELGMKGTFKVE